MVSLHSATIAWQFLACGSTDSPDAYQLRLGTASGVYTYCSCYASTVTAVSARTVLTTPATYYGIAVASLNSTVLATSTELLFTLTGKYVSVQ